MEALWTPSLSGVEIAFVIGAIWSTDFPRMSYFTSFHDFSLQDSPITTFV